VLTFVALTPVLAMVLTRVGSHYLPVQDIAVVDLRVRDVFTADTPLAGAYSRYGWNHPGPMFYWPAALLGAPFGHPAWATMVGAALTQGIAIAWLALLAWKVGRLPLVLIALGGLGLSYVAMGDWIFFEAWNPHVAFPFFALFLLQAWAISGGRLTTLVGAAITATFLVQTHVGYAPFVLSGTAYVIACLVARRASLDGRALRRSGALALAITVFLWIPPLVDQVTNTPGNLHELATFFLRGDPDAPAIGLHTAAGLMAAEFRPLMPWLGGHDLINPLFGWPDGASLWWLLVPASLLGFAAFVASRTRSERSIRLVSLTTVIALTGLVSMSRVTDFPSAYLFYWRVQIAVLVALTFAIVVGTSVPTTWRRRLAATGGVVLAVATLWGFGGIARDVVAHGDDVMAGEGPTRKILAQLGPVHGPVIVRSAGDALIGVESGLVDALDRRGDPVFVDKERAYQFGDHRTLDVSDAKAVWYVIDQGQYATALRFLPGAQTLAELTPLTPGDEERLRSVESQIIGALYAAGRPDLVSALDRDYAGFVLADIPGITQDQVQTLLELNRRRHGVCRCAVVAFPSQLAPT